MKLAKIQVTLRRALLLLGLWELLPSIQCSQGYPSWRYISSEVVIPRKLMPRGKGVQVPGWLSYSLRFGGQRHVIHMRRKKLFLPRHLQVVSQDDQGALQMDYPYVPRDCYYLGFLEEIPYSMVTIATCYGGLEGIMKVDDLAYEIKPLNDSLMFEHIVSQIVADVSATGPTYGLAYKDPPLSEVNTQAAPRVSSRVFASHLGVYQSLPIAASSVYSLFNDVRETVKYLLRLCNVINTMYHSLDFRYVVTAVIVYNVRDPAALTNTRVPGSPYHNYFKRSVYNVFKPHSSFIVINPGPSDSANDPTIRTLCTENCLIMVGRQYRHELVISLTLAFKTGRTLGLHVDGDKCYCQRRTTCIMNRNPWMTDVFSNCSIVYAQNILRQNSHCLFLRIEQYHNESMTRWFCGNSRMESGEQCDCGSLKQCYSNRCCEQNCRLTTGSVCNEELCCTNCTYSPTGTLCRPIQNVCDLPEYCTGKTHTCPDDFYLQDGTPCSEEGYCFHGNCTDRSIHCKEIFGPSAMNADHICYTINTKGSRFGHCRRKVNNIKHEPCDNQDIMCGRLQCTNITHLPSLQDHTAFHQSLISGARCFGLDEHRSTETVDVGHVRPGTPCGGGKFCSPGGYCNVSLVHLNYDCRPEKCHFRGVCNNKKNCHCHTGWDPPLCLNPGAGGSENSGPPPRRFRTITTSEEPIIYWRLVFARVYCFIFVLLFGLATNVRTISKKVDTDED